MRDRLQTFEFYTITLDDFGQVIERRRKLARFLNIELASSITLELVEIPGGSFLMGAPSSELEQRSNESPQHYVSLPSFFLGKYPLTQVQWLAVMPELPPVKKEFRGAILPVVNVWLELALEFCTRLSQQTGLCFRLPSEAEWEYACRAGTTTPFHFGPTITPELVNYNGNQPYGRASVGEFRQGLTPVGYFNAANAFGLSDLHGNVWEWCADAWHDDYRNAPTDGSAWMSGGDQSYCVQRGGSWRDNAGACRAAFRVGDIAHNADHIVGLRICLSATLL